MDRPSHDRRIAEEFTKQAASFEDADLNMAFTVGLPWLVDLVAPEPGWRALDVAAGTGWVARALAERGCEVVALDRTAAMLAAGRPSFPPTCRPVLGDAARLPFPDGVFDAVVTRFSLHHLLDPMPTLAEIVRVCRPGGRIVVKDLAASIDPEMARRQDRVETLRDSSHLSMPPAGAVGEWLERLGAVVVQVAQHDLDRPLEPWLTQAGTPQDRAETVRALLGEDLAGGVSTGLRPHREDGEIWFHQTWEVTVAQAPDRGAAAVPERRESGADPQRPTAAGRE